MKKKVSKDWFWEYPFITLITLILTFVCNSFSTLRHTFVSLTVGFKIMCALYFANTQRGWLIQSSIGWSRTICPQLGYFACPLKAVCGGLLLPPWATRCLPGAASVPPCAKLLAVSNTPLEVTSRGSGCSRANGLCRPWGQWPPLLR